MVLANETVAEYMHSIEMPFVYRIHEKPAEEKAAMFREFAQNLGLTGKIFRRRSQVVRLSEALKIRGRFARFSPC